MIFAVSVILYTAAPESAPLIESKNSQFFLPTQKVRIERSAAESLIRDADMAKEMVTHSIQNILSQAGENMMTQANQQPQGVLSLLG